MPSLIAGERARIRSEALRFGEKKEKGGGDIADAFGGLMRQIQLADPESALSKTKAEALRRETEEYEQKSELRQLQIDAGKYDTHQLLKQLGHKVMTSKTPEERAKAQKAFNVAGETVQQWARFVKATVKENKSPSQSNFVPTTLKNIKFLKKVIMKGIPEKPEKSIIPFKGASDQEIDKWEKKARFQMDQNADATYGRVGISQEAIDWAVDYYATSDGPIVGMPEDVTLPTQIGYIDEKGKRGKTIFRPRRPSTPSRLAAKPKVGDIVEGIGGKKFRVTKVGKTQKDTKFHEIKDEQSAR